MNYVIVLMYTGLKIILLCLFISTITSVSTNTIKTQNIKDECNVYIYYPTISIIPYPFLFNWGIHKLDVPENLCIFVNILLFPVNSVVICLILFVDLIILLFVTIIGILAAYVAILLCCLVLIIIGALILSPILVPIFIYICIYQRNERIIIEGYAQKN